MSMACALQKLVLLFLAAQSLILWESAAAAVYIKSPKVAERATTSHDKRAVLILPGVLWDNGRIINASFVEPLEDTSHSHERIKSIAQKWSRYANVHFNFVNRKEHDSILLISINGTGCIADGMAGVGRTIEAIHENDPDSPNVFFRNASSDKPDGTISPALREQFVILHEFGHVLGFLHEHVSPRRAEVFTWDATALADFYVREYGFSYPVTEELLASVMNPAGDDEVTAFSKFDIKSVMLSPYPSTVNNEHIELPSNPDLSELDKAYAGIIYPYFPNSPMRHVQDPKWSFGRSLDVVGVDRKTRRVLKAAYDRRDVDAIRTEMSRFSFREKDAAASEKTGSAVKEN